MLADIQLVMQVLIWFLCLVLILLILVQGGSGDLSSTFGGGGQLDSTLGVGASRKMGKITGWLSVVFLAAVLFMAIPADGSITDLTGDPSIGSDDATLGATDVEPLVEPLVEPADPSAVEVAPSADDQNNGPLIEEPHIGGTVEVPADETALELGVEEAGQQVEEAADQAVESAADVVDDAAAEAVEAVDDAALEIEVTDPATAE